MIIYQTSLEGISEEHLAGFFVGWPNPPSPQTHLNILARSQHIVLAREGSDGPVVGFITALSDGVISAYIPLLEVLPAYQRRGIGSELLQLMFIQLRELYMIDLICDPELQPYYERMGMHRASAMLLRNYERQSGISDDDLSV